VSLHVDLNDAGTPEPGIVHEYRCPRKNEIGFVDINRKIDSVADTNRQRDEKDNPRSKGDCPGALVLYEIYIQDVSSPSLLFGSDHPCSTDSTQPSCPPQALLD
jgi:hypothetical protein